MSAEEATNECQVLVLGDFFVDEHWTLVSHASSLSTFSSPVHLSSPAQHASDTRQWPAAAGLVAKILLDGFSVHGLGAWHVGDETLLSDLILCDQNASAASPDKPMEPPFVLQSSLSGTSSDRLRLYNLTGSAGPVGTSRMLRLYRRVATADLPLVLDRRIDFELPLPDSATLARSLGDRSGSPFEHVLIKDHHRGIASVELLHALSDRGWVDNNTAWYICSSHPEPAWMLELATGRDKLGTIRLAVLPAAAVSAEKVTDDISNEWRTNRAFAEYWFAAGAHPTVDALHVLGSFLKLDGSALQPGSLVVAMPGGRNLLAVRYGSSGPEELFTHSDAFTVGEQRDLIGGRSSVFLGRLASAMISSSRQTVSYETLIKDALEASDAYMSERLTLLTHRQQAIQFGGTTPPILRKRWETEKRDWNHALGKQGVGIIVANPGDARVDLWRAMVPLKQYIETVDSRADTVRRLARSLRRFRRDSPNRSVSVEIRASPGFGKSYLVERLASEFDFRLLKFNITQLVTRDNVIACFDAIASAQTQDRSHPFLVFFDEINAKLGNAAVYDLFLTVLEDGTYLRGGQKFKLAPCAWVFAGTTVELTGENGGELNSIDASGGALDGTRGRPARLVSDDPTDKYQDFVSRLDVSATLDEDEAVLPSSSVG